jgi:hypothetical protein
MIRESVAANRRCVPLASHFSKVVKHSAQRSDQWPMDLDKAL